MNHLVKILSLVIIAVSIYFATWSLFRNDIVFHTDIARDFLLIEDIVTNKPITLIGPRSGGIPGVFHGPLWLYLNVPAYIIGQGNPVVVGWFWVVLYIASLFVTYKVASKLFSKEAGYLSSALLGVVLAESVPSLFNPFGAVILSPVFFYYFWQFIKRENIKHLLISLFTLGIIIQFQMAFGLPVLTLTIFYLLIFLIKKRKIKYLAALFILLIPLSTFIAFDVKHDFLQTKAVINYVTGKENIGKVDKKFGDLLKDRINGALVDGTGFVTKYEKWPNTIILITFLLTVIYLLRKKRKNRLELMLFLYFYLGFWALTLLFKGMIWSYYYWPFLPLIAIFLGLAYEVIDKRIVLAVFVTLFIFNTQWHINHIKQVEKKDIGKHGGSWIFNKQAATKIFSDVKGEFGYYIFTGDLFGYSQRYAMNYIQSKSKTQKAYPYEKKGVTYLLISPTDNPFLNVIWWKENQVGIKKEPTEVIKYESGFRVEKYMLTSDEVKAPSDPNLLNSLIFR